MEKDFKNIFDNMDEMLTKASEQQQSIESKFIAFSDTQKEIESKLEVINKKFEQQIAEFKISSETILDKIKQDSDNLTDETQTKIQKFIKNSELVITDFKTKSEELVKILHEKSSRILDDFERLIELKADKSDIDVVKKDISNLCERVDKLEQYTHKHLILGGKI